MAVSSREELRCRFEGPAFVSNSERSPWASKATGKVETGDVKESNKCKHFTIRGYVAGVRKRDAKSCWPFMHCGCTMLESADLFPPLCVANFKWWGCHDCVNEMISTAPQMTTEGSMCIRSQAMKNNNNALLENVAETSQQEAIKFISRLPLISEENYGEGRVTTEYCSMNFSKHEKEGNEGPLRNIMKDGFRICKDGYDCHGKARHALQEANCASDVHPTAKAEEKGASRNPIGRSLGFTYPKQVLSTGIIRNKGTNLRPNGDSKLVSGDSSIMRAKLSLCNSEDVQPESMKAAKKSGIDVKKGQRKSMKLHNMVGKDYVLYADEAHIGHGTCDMRSCGASFCDTKSMGDWPEMEDDMESMHSKKIRKVRLLEDIIRNTEQHMAENNRSLAGDRTCVEHDLSRRPDTQKRKVLLLNHTSDVYPQNIALRSARCTSQTQNLLNEDENKGGAVPHPNERDLYGPQRNSLKFVERFDTYEDLSDEGKGSSLMHWLKSVSRKVNADKGEATTQRRKVFVSNFSADLSVGNDQDLYIKDCDPLECTLEPTSRQTQALVRRDSGLPKNILGCEGSKSKNYRYKNITTKGVVILDKKQQCRMENSDSTGKNTLLHGVRNKRSISSRAKSYQAQDALAAQAKAGSEAWELESIKPRNMQTTDSENIDDIPMDIVELLARNQHDRHRLKPETNSTINHLPEMTERTQCGYGIDHAQSNRSNGSCGEQENLSVQQKVQVSNKGFGVWSKFRNDSNMEIGQQAYHCSANGKKKLQIDLNLQYSDPVVHRTGLCNLENEGDCHQLNLPCKNSIFSLQSSCLMDCPGAYENLCTDSHGNGNTLKHMNGTLLGVKNHTYSNSITATSGRNFEMFAPLSNYAPRNLVEMHHHLGSYPTNNEVSKASFIGFANGYHPNFCPEDVRRTENASAMNLLRLMDHAAWSGKPHFEGHTGLTETNMCFDDLCNESIRSEYGTKGNHPCICSVESVYPMVWRQPRNSCLPFRPLPRIGVLGPSLQKEILNCSNYSTVPSRSSHGFLKTGVQEKIGPCHSIPNPLFWNCNASISRCICSEKFGPNRCNISDDTPCITRNGISQLQLNHFDAVPPSESFCTRENCVVNRNPAEFNLLDEHNEYMIEIKDPKHKSPPTSGCHQRFKKKQRVMKLNDLKGCPFYVSKWLEGEE